MTEKGHDRASEPAPGIESSSAELESAVGKDFAQELCGRLALLYQVTASLLQPAGLVMSSAFSAMVVYAQEAVPGRVGLISGLMFGLMFGIGGMGAAGLGQLADMKGNVWVYGVTSFLPLLGLATAFLPSTRKA